MAEARLVGVPFAFSAAGFKALPHKRPPALPLQGLVLLMGSNSAGKSSLLLALRLLARSQLHEPLLERLHLRAPGIPAGRLAHVEDLFHRAAAHGSDAREGREITFRIVFSGGDMLQLVYSLGEDGRDRREGMQRPVAPLSLRRVTEGVGRVFRADGHVLDPWGGSWQPLNGAEAERVEQELLSTLEAWSRQAAFLDSIRAEQQGPERRSVGEWVDSGSVLPRGENAAVMFALAFDGDLGGPDEWPQRSEGPLSGHSWILPDGAEAVTTAWFMPEPWTGPPDHLSALLRCCGLAPLVLNQWGPGYPTEFATSKERVGLADLGDGQRQVFPALVQALLSGSDTTLCWEHPDLHLHPGGATGLGRIAYRLAALGRSVIIETHSRDLVAGVQSEAAAVKLACTRDPAVPLEHVPATLLYLLADGEGIKSHSYRLDHPGTEVPLWPGFVDLDVVEQQRFSESLGPVPLEADEAWLRSLLPRGEGDRVEWKASLSWNRVEARSDRAVTARVMRAVAALCNTHGGTLVVGVDDSGELVGWDPNLPDFDSFQQHLANLVEREFGAGWYPEHLHAVPVATSAGAVAIIQCKAASQPVRIWHEKQQRRALAVRVASTSRFLPAHQEGDWIARRFPG